ncbi:MAG: hypothetical protein A2W91_02320 [Bacteroidetes bacterium GWF2_38_335]|nr:MAG: hypothetical protein A2W91_02320 [Bacteroidetes bacterium GWF2_38_335]OFY80685.1 MAG: hypothetical protein A2281_05335 [Bacteroidetes bacterium RIFOXYA12_FULL_38_20]HBS87030.1 hypothetical protein [Bacteroidales bacterium]
MKKFFRRFLIVLLVLVILAGGFVAWLYFSPGGERNAFSVIPDDAIFIIETSNLTDGWEELTESNFWKNLTRTEFFADVNEDAKMLDDQIKDSETMAALLSGRQLLISAHMIPGKEDYDFLFVIDVEKAEKLTFLVDLLQTFDKSIEQDKYKECDLIYMIDGKDTTYIGLIDNLLVATFSKTLLAKAIDQKDDNFWEKNEFFTQVKSDISDEEVFNLYLNYSQIDNYMSCFMEEESDLMNDLSQSLYFSAFNMSLNDKYLKLQGYTNWSDEYSSYIKVLGHCSPGKMRAYEILSENTALYLALCFDSFETFKKGIEEEFKSDPSNKEDLRMVEKVEKFLKISFREDFFSWIGNEIAFVKLKPKSNSKEYDVIAAIHAADINKAKEGLGHIMRQIKRRTPGKFKEFNHKGYDIYYMEINGFFKLFLGKLFRKLDKPYFTYIEDYVVFANTPSIIMEIVDDYLVGKTLVHNEDFMAFRDRFDSKTNITVFVQMAQIYQHLFYYTDVESREGIKKNKEVIMSFTHLGFQMVSDGERFENLIYADHGAGTYNLEDLDKIEASADQTFNGDFEQLKFKVVISPEPENPDGPFKLYFDEEETQIKAEGMLKNGKPHGLCRSYYESGNISSSVNYDEGVVNGSATFYYDNETRTIKAKVDFEEDQIIDVYYEFYENGSRKAKINYDDGLPDGRAEYYYDSGNLMIIGKFDKGKKKGKWKFYTESGQLYDKQKNH